MFERDMLDLQQKYNVEVRYTNYVDSDLKYEMRARTVTTRAPPLSVRDDSTCDQV